MVANSGFAFSLGFSLKIYASHISYDQIEFGYELDFTNNTATVDGGALSLQVTSDTSGKASIMIYAQTRVHD